MENGLLISSILLWVVVLFNLLLTIALVRRVNSQPSNIPDLESIPTLEIGEPAPNFEAESLSGELVSLDHYFQQRVALVFISPQCTPCLDKIPTLNTLGPKAKKHGVDLVLVAISDREETRVLVERYDIQLPILSISRDNLMREDFKVSGTPFFCLIDDAGRVEATGMLMAEWEQLSHKWRMHPDEVIEQVIEKNLAPVSQ